VDIRDVRSSRHVCEIADIRPRFPSICYLTPKSDCCYTRRVNERNIQ
jgi:hypothetical protein